MKVESTGRNRGQLTLELLLAMALLAIGLTSVIAVHFGNQSIFLDSRLNNRALYMARGELESARARARQDLGLLQPYGINEGIYTRQLLVENTGTFSRKVTSNIIWQIGPLRTLNIALTTVIADWEALLEVGGGGGLSGDWADPVTASQEDLGPNNEGTDVDVLGNYLYVTAAPSGAGGGPAVPRNDFYIYRIVNPFSPGFISSIDTGKGLISLSVEDDYAYAASINGSAQLQIIGGLPASPTLVSTSTMAGNSSPGTTIFARDEYVFIGSKSSVNGAELQVFSAASKTNPSIVDTVEIGADVRDIYLYKDRLYVTTGDDDRQVLIYDASDPSNLNLISTYTNGTGATSNAIFPVNYSTLFVGIADRLYSLDTIDLQNIQMLGQYDAGGRIIDLYVRDYLAFAGVDESNTEFQVINTTDYSDLFLHSSLNFPQVVTGIDYQDNFVYSSVRSNNGIRIITSRNE